MPAKTYGAGDRSLDYMDKITVRELTQHQDFLFGYGDTAVSNQLYTTVNTGREISDVTANMPTFFDSTLIPKADA